MPNRFSARLRAKQLSLSQLLPPSSPTTRQLRTRRDQNPPLRRPRLDRQLSNPKPSNPTKEKLRKKKFSPPTTTMTTMIKTMKAVKNRLRRRQKKNGNPTISEEKKLKILYTKGPAALGSVKNLTNCNIRPNTTQRRSVEKVPVNDWQASVTLILLVFHRLDLAS